jgi:hypothetical protein
MSARAVKRDVSGRLRASPSFALTFTLDGRPYIAKDTEPYIQYWLSERYRILLSLFSRRGGATAADAAEGYFRLTRTSRSAAERERLRKALHRANRRSLRGAPAVPARTVRPHDSQRASQGRKLGA